MSFGLPPRGTLDTFSDTKAARLFERFARNGTAQVPTLVEEQSFALVVSNTLMDQRGMNFVPPSMQKPWDLPGILIVGRTTVKREAMPRRGLPSIQPEPLLAHL